jgi:hypothetical protein
MFKLATVLRHRSLQGVRPPCIIYYGESTLLVPLVRGIGFPKECLRIIITVNWIGIPTLG